MYSILTKPVAQKGGKMKKAYWLYIVVLLILLGGCAINQWEQARSQDTAEAYYVYIRNNPKGEFLKEANSKLASFEDAEWAATKKDYENMHRFFTLYPKTKYLPDIKDKIRETLCGFRQLTQNIITPKKGDVVDVINLTKDDCLLIQQINESSLDLTYFQREESKKMGIPFPHATFISETGSFKPFTIDMIQDYTNPFRLSCRPASSPGRYDLVYESGSGIMPISSQGTTVALFVFCLCE